MYLLLGIVGAPILFLTMFWFIPMWIYEASVDAWYEHKARRKRRKPSERKKERMRIAEQDSTLSITSLDAIADIALRDYIMRTKEPHKLRIPDEDGNLHTIWSTELDDLGLPYSAGSYSLVHAIMRRDAEGTRVDPTYLDRPQ